MPNQILNKKNNIVFSSDLEILNFFVESDFGFVELCEFSDSDIDTIFYEKFYTHNRKISVFNLSSVIETFMRNNNFSFHRFRINLYTDNEEAFDDSWDFYVIYCDRKIFVDDVSEFISENFLCSCEFRRIPKSADIFLNFIALCNEDLICTVDMNCEIYNSGVVKICSISSFLEHVGNEIKLFNISYNYDSLASMAANFFGCDESNINILSFTLSVGNRSMSFFVDGGMSLHNCFYFNNCFNAMDVIYFNGINSKETSVEKSSAFIHGVYKFYDVKASETFSVQSGGLSEMEADLFSQLISSFYISRKINDNFLSVLISNESFDVSDADDKLCSVKFNWKYDFEKPMLAFDFNNIFSEQFSNQFD